MYRFKEDREVHDHVYVTFEYPGGRTAVFTSIESNAWDDYYELHMGTKGTLLLRAEREAFFFEEGTRRRPESRSRAASDLWPRPPAAARPIRPAAPPARQWGAARPR